MQNFTTRRYQLWQQLGIWWSSKPCFCHSQNIGFRDVTTSAIDNALFNAVRWEQIVSCLAEPEHYTSLITIKFRWQIFHAYSLFLDHFDKIVNISHQVAGVLVELFRVLMLWSELQSGSVNWITNCALLSSYLLPLISGLWVSVLTCLSARSADWL